MRISRHDGQQHNKYNKREESNDRIGMQQNKPAQQEQIS